MPKAIATFWRKMQAWRAERRLRTIRRWEGTALSALQDKNAATQEENGRLMVENRLLKLQVDELTVIHATDVERWKAAVNAQAVAPIRDRE